MKTRVPFNHCGEHSLGSVHDRQEPRYVPWRPPQLREPADSSWAEWEGSATSWQKKSMYYMLMNGVWFKCISLRAKQTFMAHYLFLDFGHCVWAQSLIALVEWKAQLLLMFLLYCIVLWLHTLHIGSEGHPLFKYKKQKYCPSLMWTVRMPVLDDLLNK